MKFLFTDPCQEIFLNAPDEHGKDSGYCERQLNILPTKDNITAKCKKMRHNSCTNLSGLHATVGHNSFHERFLCSAV